MADRILVEQVVRFAFLIRLASLLLVLMLPDRDLHSILGLLAVAFIIATSAAGLYGTAALTSRVAAHPILLVVDVLVAAIVAATFGSQSPIILYSLSTAVLIGMLLRRSTAGLVVAILVSAYLLVAIVEDTGRGATAPVLLPVVYVILAAMGALTRHFHESAMAEHARARHVAEDAARERERARLAREMHDSVAKSLHGISLAAAALPARAGQGVEVLAAKAQELQAAAESASQDARSILIDLRADTDDRTLAQQLRALTDDLAGGGIRSRLTVSGVGDCDHSIKSQLVAIASEAVENIRRHSGASAADVSCIGNTDSITVTVSDDGVGFDAAAMPHGHYGVVGMRERAGTIGARLDLTTAPGEGSTIVVSAARTIHGGTP